jgi:hypothetical protein
LTASQPVDFICIIIRNKQGGSVMARVVIGSAA